MHSPSPGIQSKITAVSLVLTLATLWLLMKGYHGLTGDAQLYAFQALARIHPSLTSDLYLQNTSQDQFTVFSPLYARFIGALGLEHAARLLTLVFTAGFLAAAWSLARALTGRDTAWLAAGFLLIVAADYGGSGVFHFSETYLTARLPAEALIVTALACHAAGMKRLGLSLAAAALIVHPLIALPGLLLLICLRLPYRVSAMAAAAGVAAVFGLAAAATRNPGAAQAFTVMDPAWLEVVRERSQFLFLPLWSFHDWEINTRPFIYLGVTAIAVPDERIRRFCMTAALVGAAGLSVALIGSLLGPVAILVQGQAWRWVWPAVFLSALMLPVTVRQVWRDAQCGPLCALLLICGWTLSAVEGCACASIALSLWVTRTRMSSRAAPYGRWLAAALGVAMVAWLCVKSWAIVSPSIVASGHLAWGAAQLRDVFGLKLPALIFGALVWWWARSGGSVWVPACLCAMLIALSIALLPAAFKQARVFASASDVDEFAAWIHAIPATSTVLVAPSRDVGAFVWFTLGRPNYLALDQSAGVVFSRATSLEVQRRSQVLLPLTDPNWKILTGLRRAAATGQRATDVPTRPLTAARLMQVCADPELGFVISPENIGFDPLRHEAAGAWKDWNLYDCRPLRPAAPLEHPPA